MCTQLPKFSLVLLVVVAIHEAPIVQSCLAVEGDAKGPAPNATRCVATYDNGTELIDDEALFPPEADVKPELPSFVKGQIIVKLADNAYLATLQADSLVQSTAPVFKHVSRLVADPASPAAPGSRDPSKAQKIADAVAKRGLARYHVVHLQSGVSPKDVMTKYKDDVNIESLQPNYIYYPDLVPDDSRYAEQYAHQRTFVEDAWDVETGSANVTVAVLGGGVDVDHPDLAANIWANSGEIPDNGYDDDSNGFIDDAIGWDFENNDKNPRPDTEHETGVAGIIAAVGDNAEGIAGVAWNASIMVIRAGYNSTDMAAAIEYAHQNGADIINMSFGNYDKERYGDGIVQDAIDAAYENGVLLIATAGNDSVDTNRYPAALYNVLAVGATDEDDALARWHNNLGGSNYGPWVDLAAPGKDILTTYYPRQRLRGGNGHLVRGTLRFRLGESASVT